MKKHTGLILSLVAFTSISTTSVAQDMEKLFNMDIAELTEMEITSVSRAPESRFKAPAATYIITKEAIKRSGYTSVPDILRLAPGFSVASVSASDYAITTRGFNGLTANKLLVLINGRTLYSTTTAGTRWYVDDPILENIERIELIRGPGATIWGANAVNGVVNIITKDTSETLGTQITLGTGNLDQALITAQHGFQFGEATTARVYSRAQQHASHDLLTTGTTANDSWRRGDFGFELDWEGESDRVEIEGRLYHFDSESIAPIMNFDDGLSIERGPRDSDDNGGHFMAKWSRNHSDISSSFLQFFVTTQNRDLNEVSYESFTTYDLEGQYITNPNDTLELTFGMNLRQYQTKINETNVVVYEPVYRKANLFAGLVQAKQQLGSEDLILTSGIKVERNDFSGWEFQPSARIAWTPDEKQTIWASFSHAVRTPALFYEDGTLVLDGFPLAGLKDELPLVLQGQPYPLDAEDLYAYELGYRAILSDDVAIDIAAFYSHYENLFGSQQPGPPRPVSVRDVTVPALVVNYLYDISVDFYGIENVITYTPTSSWTLEGSYSYLATNEGSSPTQGAIPSGTTTTPDHMATLRSLWRVLPTLDLDAIVRYVDKLPLNFGNSEGDVPSYIQLDLRIGWRPTKNLEISIAAINLIDDTQWEFVDEFSQTGILNPRSYVGRLTYNF